MRKKIGFQKKTRLVRKENTKREDLSPSAPMHEPILELEVDSLKYAGSYGSYLPTCISTNGKKRE